MLNNISKVLKENEICCKWANVVFPIVIIGIIGNIVSLCMGKIIIAEICAIVVILVLFMFTSLMTIVVKDTWEITRQFIEKYANNMDKKENP